MLRSIAVLAFALFAATGVRAADCPVEQAVYSLRGQPEITAGFIPARHGVSAQSDLYAFVTTTERTYWFSMTASNGYSSIYLLPVTDPYHPADANDGPQPIGSAEDGASIALYPLDASLDIAVNPPNKGDMAPAYLFTPELGPTLWYSPASLTTDPAAGRDSIDRALFEVTDCLAAPREPAHP